MTNDHRHKCTHFTLLIINFSALWPWWFQYFSPRNPTIKLKSVEWRHKCDECAPLSVWNSLACETFLAHSSKGHINLRHTEKSFRAMFDKVVTAMVYTGHSTGQIVWGHHTRVPLYKCMIIQLNKSILIGRLHLRYCTCCREKSSMATML